MHRAEKNIAIIGGGAGGFFCAIRAAELASLKNEKVTVTIYESSSKVLKKVKISGGGRCNVTHRIYERNLFSQNYPRGSRELKSPFQSFCSLDTIDWFKQRDVEIKAEADGRMFPVTDSSSTIISCFEKEVARLNVQLKLSTPIVGLKKLENHQFCLFTQNQEIIADNVLLATGSSAKGYELAKGLGHTITELAPSLFTFKVKHPLLEEAAGTAFPSAGIELKMDGQKSFKQEGPLLITHWGLSGPALLKLSAWAAREMKRVNYQATIKVNWLGLASEDEVRQALQSLKQTNSRSNIQNSRPEPLTKKFWSRILKFSNVDPEQKWSDVSKKQFNKLISVLYASHLPVAGKSRFKEEFVECGGVQLKQVNFKTMESKVCPGLYFSGEILDVDGITGGFNFQNAWTTAWLAANAMLEH